MPSRGRVAAVGLALGWLVTTAALFILAEVVGARHIPNPDAAAVAAAALRIAALLATLAGVAGYSRRLHTADAERLHREQAEQAEQAHEARSALAAIEHAARALPPEASPLPLGDAIVSEVAVIRRLFDGGADSHYVVAEALLGPVTVARLAGAEVEVSLEDGLTAAGDPAAFGQIAQGLLDNARRHAAGAAIAIRGRREADRIRVVFEDDGPGIDPSVSGELFESGVRSRASGGTGFGLAAARRAAADLGGELSLLDSSSGAAFLLDIPAAVTVGIT